MAFLAYNFHLLQSWMWLGQFFIFSFFMSFLISSSHLFFGLPSGRVNIGFHLYTLTILSSSIHCKWPNQLNLCAVMWFIIFLCLINSSNRFWFSIYQQWRNYTYRSFSTIFDDIFLFILMNMGHVLTQCHWYLFDDAFWVVFSFSSFFLSFFLSIYDKKSYLWAAALNSASTLSECVLLFVVHAYHLASW